MASELLAIVLAAFTVTACAKAKAPPSAEQFSARGLRRADQDFNELRHKHVSKLVVRAPSPQEYESGTPRGVERVTIEGAEGDLFAWRLAPRTRGRKPLCIFAHGGFALGAEDVAATLPFLQAGMVVLMPAVRGENGNPGNYEMFYGELDDLARIVRHAARMPEVDPSRIYVFGHSAGGALAALISLVPDLPIAATGSSGGVYSPRLLLGMRDLVPFDADDPGEAQLRSLLPFAHQMKRIHHAYLGRDDAYLMTDYDAVVEAAKWSSGRLKVHVVDGDHLSSLETAVRHFLADVGQ